MDEFAVSTCIDSLEPGVSSHSGPGGREGRCLLDGDMLRGEEGWLANVRSEL